MSAISMITHGIISPIVEVDSEGGSFVMGIPEVTEDDNKKLKVIVDKVKYEGKQGTLLENKNVKKEKLSVEVISKFSND